MNDPLDLDATFRFLTGLKKNNDREWFNANRAAWDETIKPGWEDLIAGLLIAGTSFDERLAHIDPRKCIFRINRDVRFSNDKSPYKPQISAWLSGHGKHGSNPGFYVQVSPGNSFIGAGIWSPEKDALGVLRHHFAEADLRAYDRIVKAKAFAAYLPLETDPLQRSPAGIAKDHPRPELVRARRYIVHRSFRDADLKADGAFKTFKAAMRDTAAFVAYLDAIAPTGDFSTEEAYD